MKRFLPLLPLLCLYQSAGCNNDYPPLADISPYDQSRLEGGMLFPDGGKFDQGSGPEAGAVEAGADLSLPEAGCSPNSFLSCVGSTLVSCDASGKAVNTDCSPYLCNSTAQRCNECEPSTSSCESGSSVACSANGLKQTPQACTYGCNTSTGLCFSCQTTTYYADSDGDTYGDPNASLLACSQPAGHVLNKLDCDDADANAFPGQTKWFDTPTKGNNDYDYDCDLLEKKQYSTLFLWCDPGCNAEGWSAAQVPGCGVLEYWETCFEDPWDPTCDSNAVQVKQRCH